MCNRINNLLELHNGDTATLLLHINNIKNSLANEIALEPLFYKFESDGGSTQIRVLFEYMIKYMIDEKHINISRSDSEIIALTKEIAKQSAILSHNYHLNCPIKEQIEKNITFLERRHYYKIFVYLKMEGSHVNQLKALPDNRMIFSNYFIFNTFNFATLDNQSIFTNILIEKLKLQFPCTITEEMKNYMLEALTKQLLQETNSPIGECRKSAQLIFDLAERFNKMSRVMESICDRFKLNNSDTWRDNIEEYYKNTLKRQEIVFFIY